MKTKPVSNEKGQVLIFVTLAFVILGMFIGLAVDGGRAYLMRERLRSIVDAAALAGAKAMAGPPDPIQAQQAAVTAACEWAKINGLDAGSCDGGKLVVEVGPAPDGTLGVIVTGTDTSRTFFMALGGLIGCESCKTIDVKHVGIAVPDTLVDLVLVMDDTGTMNHNCNATFDNAGCPIFGAKQGAAALISMLLADPKSHAKIAFVPFRGCYKDVRNSPDVLLQNYVNRGLTQQQIDRIGCIFNGGNNDERVNLTNDASTLTAAINTHFGAGGYPGTNVCLGMREGRNKLFDPERSRAIARKVMVILTDGDQTYSDSADGPQPSANPPIPSLGDPTPTPYPAHQWQAGAGDGGPLDNCMSSTSPSLDSTRWGSDYDNAIYDLDIKARDYASSIKDPNGDSKLEVYVLRFADPPGDGDSTSECAPGSVNDRGYSGRQNPNDPRDQNLSRCLASNTVMGDPFAIAANDHYFYAAIATDINTKFQNIATNILRKRRLVA